MEEQKRTPAAWPDRYWIGLLVLVAIGLRTWQIVDTEVTARDSLWYISNAWQLHQRSFAEWPAVLSSAKHHPGYSIAILLVSGPVRFLSTRPLADQMQFSAQLASALASVFLVWPMFLLGRELFNRRVAFGAALLLQCLPASGRLFPDGLSESTFLLWVMFSLYWSARGLKLFRLSCRESSGLSGAGIATAFGLAGVFGALAYLTRPEGVVVIIAAGLVLVAGSAIAWRPKLCKLTLCTSCLVVGSILVGAPYVVAIGGLTVKPSGRGLINEVVERSPPRQAGPLLAAWSIDNGDADRFSFAWHTFGWELLKGSHFLGLPLAILGFWCFRARLMDAPGLWVLIVLFLILSALLWRLVLLWGYLSDRHMILLIVAGSFWASAGLTVIGTRIEGLIRMPKFNSGWAWGLVLLAFAGSGLPKTLARLHAHRTGYHAAGHWLAEHAAPTDSIEDPNGWARYYAGRFFQNELPSPPDAVHYVVVEGSADQHKHIFTLPAALAKAARGQLVYAHPNQQSGRQKAEIRVYALPGGP